MNKGIVGFPPTLGCCATISLVSWMTTDHDRAPGAVDPNPTPALSDALDRLRLSGAIFLRAEYPEGWAFESMPGEDLARILVPGRRQVVLFHVVARGRCWVAADDGVKHW